MPNTPTQPVAGTVAHFAINTDDVDNARRFYGSVFDWRFEPWGPPSFFHIVTASGDVPGPIGALQQRRDLDGRRVTGFECTVAVDDLDRVMEAATTGGGRVVMAPTTITGVGHLIFLADPSGNICGAMQYDPTAD